MAKREKRPPRLAWFALDVDAFLDDPRMQQLTNKQKAFWALMIIKGFRNGGEITTNPQIVAEQTGASPKEAKELIAQLLTLKLLTPTDSIFRAISTRLQKEHEIAQQTYDRYSQLGKTSAEKNSTINLKLV